MHEYSFNQCCFSNDTIIYFANAVLDRQTREAYVSSFMQKIATVNSEILEDIKSYQESFQSNLFTPLEHINVRDSH